MEHFNPILGNETTGQKFITCGEIMLRLTPPNYEKIRMASGFEASYGGSEANIALALANLGVDSTFFSVVPNNSLGKSAIRWLRCNDVHCTPMILTEPDETPSNRLGTYYLETGYGIRPSKVIYDRKHSAITEYDFSQVDLDALLDGFNWLHLSGITPALAPNCRSLILDMLKVASFASSEPFWQAMRTEAPELVILDVMLPGEDGFSILKKLRNTPSLHRLPIIMVTAKSSELDTVRGLDCGADDYISKPFGIMEFLSRVRASLRRAAPEERPNVLSFHEILLDNARHSVTVNNQPVELTYKEYSLLRLLLENTNLVVTRETILQVVWGTDISVESRTVDMHIRTLRKKLGDAGRYIGTIRKVGYKLADDDEAGAE